MFKRNCLKQLWYLALLKFQIDVQFLNEASLSSSTFECEGEHNFQTYLCEFLIQMQGISPKGKRDAFNMGASAGRTVITDPDATNRLQQSHPPLHSSCITDYITSP